MQIWNNQLCIIVTLSIKLEKTEHMLQQIHVATSHYEITPIQIDTENFTSKNLKFSD